MTQENPDSPVWDNRRWALAGYLSGEPEYRDHHPEALLPLADRILSYMNDLAALDRDPIHIEDHYNGDPNRENTAGLADSYPSVTDDHHWTDSPTRPADKDHR